MFPVLSRTIDCTVNLIRCIEPEVSTTLLRGDPFTVAPALLETSPSEKLPSKSKVGVKLISHTPGIHDS